MSITTKTGDRGMTSLCWGGRVPKDNPRIEAVGTIDELVSFLGIAKSLVKKQKVKGLLESLQRDLFIAGAEISTLPRFLGKLTRVIGSDDVTRLERIIVEYEKKRSFEECCFYLPGGFLASTLDVTRTITRRAERRIVSLLRKRMIKNRFILIFFNRLSDLLYLLARENENTHVKL